MFGKKKDKPIKVLHYEGIEGFASDYPCTLELTDDTLVISQRMWETGCIITRPSSS